MDQWIIYLQSMYWDHVGHIGRQLLKPIPYNSIMISTVNVAGIWFREGVHNKLNHMKLKASCQTGDLLACVERCPIMKKICHDPTLYFRIFRKHRD